MVKVREDQPLLDNGNVDKSLWLDRLQETAPHIDRAPVAAACDLAEEAESRPASKETLWSTTAGSFRVGLEMADILAELHADTETLVAAILYRAVREGRLSREEVRSRFGPVIDHLIEGVLRMAAISAMNNPTRKAVLGQGQGQLDNLRKMLVAMIDDVRVALIKLAERTSAIRAVKNESEERKRQVAREIFDIYAPLAHRLGVGQLKWELEDLSFRYLQPGAYKKIAALLDEKRLDRQHYIENVIEELHRQLGRSGITAEITGRAKHIYSIWRKMQKKNIDFYEVYDVRAVRILVDNVRDCYAALGVVHSLWQHIPREFDDYIATPKENGYQSLHTAVIGPERKILEVQIRTYAMHEDAELGVCAHWRYKEGTSDPADKNRAYESKIAWLRQVLEWHDEVGDSSFDGFVEQLSHDDSSRIYVFTPNGHVVDLDNGATPIDFAYAVHTEVGHQCRGAKVNGHIVPLNYKLKTGEQVEVLTSPNARPSRDWLNPSLNFVTTASARNKIQSWFKKQDREEHLKQGREILERELRRLAIEKINLDELAPRVNLKTGDDVLVALGAGDLRPAQVVNLVHEPLRPPQEELKLRQPRFDEAKRASEINIQGVGNLLTHMASCCQPVPGDPILGFVTLGKGITVHRQDCQNMLHLQGEHPDRVVEVSWSQESAITYPVDIYIKAYDRQGLLRDIMGVLADEKVNITASHTESNQMEGTATILVTIEIASLGRLGKVLAKMAQLPNVIEAQRYKK